MKYFEIINDNTFDFSVEILSDNLIKLKKNYVIMNSDDISRSGFVCKHSITFIIDNNLNFLSKESETYSINKRATFYLNYIKIKKELKKKIDKDLDFLNEIFPSLHYNNVLLGVFDLNFYDNFYIKDIHVDDPYETNVKDVHLIFHKMLKVDNNEIKVLSSLRKMKNCLENNSIYVSSLNNVMDFRIKKENNISFYDLINNKKFRYEILFNENKKKYIKY